MPPAHHPETPVNSNITRAQVLTVAGAILFSLLAWLGLQVWTMSSAASKGTEQVQQWRQNVEKDLTAVTRLAAELQDLKMTMTRDLQDLKNLKEYWKPGVDKDLVDFRVLNSSFIQATDSIKQMLVALQDLTAALKAQQAQIDDQRVQLIRIENALNGHAPLKRR